MVRNDGVDFGLWRSVSPAKLIVPLDTHIVRIGRCLRLTRYTAPGWRMAADITASLRLLDPGAEADDGEPDQFVGDLVVPENDAISGIDSCTTTPYSGPDNGSASLSGTCTDLAGNSSSSVAFNFKYDATPPIIAVLSTHASRTATSDPRAYEGRNVNLRYTMEPTIRYIQHA